MSSILQDKEAINWLPEPIITNESDWILSGAYRQSGNIVIENNGKATVQIDIPAPEEDEEPFKTSYLRVTIDMAGNNSLSTSDVHNVAVVVETIYEISREIGEHEQVLAVVSDCVYPRYRHELDIKIFEAVIKGVRNKRVVSIKATIFNFETSNITIRQGSEIRFSYTDESKALEYADKKFNASLLIPLITSISEMNDKPDGYIARCNWIEGVDF